MSLLIKGVSVTCKKGNSVLTNVSLKIEPGEFVAVMGPSGSGKSTLLQVCQGGAWRNDGLCLTGTVDTGGCLPSFRSGADRALPDLRVRKFLEFQAKLGWDGESGKVDDVLRRFELEDLQDTRIKHIHNPVALSSLVVATSLMTGADICLLDEPTTGLSVQEANWLLSGIAQHDERTRVCVLHEFSDFVLNVTDRIVFLIGGSVVFDGSPRNLSLFVNGLPNRPPSFHLETVMDCFVYFPHSLEHYSSGTEPRQIPSEVGTLLATRFQEWAAGDPPSGSSVSWDSTTNSTSWLSTAERQKRGCCWRSGMLFCRSLRSNFGNKLYVLSILLGALANGLMLGYLFNDQIADKINGQLIDVVPSSLLHSPWVYYLAEAPAEPLVSFLINGADGNGWPSEVPVGVSGQQIHELVRCLDQDYGLDAQYPSHVPDELLSTEFDLDNPAMVIDDVAVLLELLDLKFDPIMNSFSCRFPTIGLFYWPCVLSRLKPHVDPLLSCLGLPVLPGLSAGRQLQTSEMTGILDDTVVAIRVALDYMERIFLSIYTCLQVAIAMFIFICMMGFAAYAAVVVYFQEKALMRRENADGLQSPLLFVVNRAATDVCVYIVPAVGYAATFFAVFVSGAYPEVDGVGLLIFVVSAFTFLFACLSYAAMIASFAADVKQAMLLMPGPLLIFLLFSGVLIRSMTVPSALRWMFDASFFYNALSSLLPQVMGTSDYFGLLPKPVAIQFAGVVNENFIFHNLIMVGS
ncbi:MAG: uncharacterized protein KVP18_001367 [Porospora cf. gigantea A]|uniref:uncharacterized protein n=1 Tax=Porospora cf. gigantea A TaxID=2853593 RepID=UPI00355A7033|nr:MAG: hypothetical protein KVP18_001367 [Porospora cf. gigantea A]